MPLIDAINKVFNVADDIAAVGGGLAMGATNRTGFARCIVRTLIPSVSVPVPSNPQRRLSPRPNGTIYVPPGEYRVGPDPVVVDNWLINFNNRPIPESALNARKENIFGASLIFPAGTTLWLAPGAVLMPEYGCVIDISSVLVCGNTKCFDLSLGGLVVFGSAVPAVRPEWWGVNREDDASGAIQAAIDAAIHDRIILWPIAGTVLAWSRPPLIVELRGVYRVGTTLNVRADRSSNGVLLQHRSGGRAPSGASVAGCNASTVIRGRWDGAQQQGATLVAQKQIGENPILRLTHCTGMTVQGVAFECAQEGYQPAVELRTSSIESLRATSLPATQGMAFRACRFEGMATPLVQVGARTEIIADDPTFGIPYAVARTEGGSDFSLLFFEDCEFVVAGNGVAIDVKANQTLPVRYRRCDFSGRANAMLSLWGATHYLQGCYFDNQRAPEDDRLDAAQPPRGLELPNGSDIFLRAEYPTLYDETLADLSRPFVLFPRLATGPLGQVLVGFEFDYLPGLTALGCVSRSGQFLSTVMPSDLVAGQNAEWPVVLLSVRHRRAGDGIVPSVRWGLTNNQSSIRRDERQRRMHKGGPLLVIGGSYSSDIVFLRGACHGAVVGVRTATLPAVRLVNLPYPGIPSHPTTVFGLRVDQR